MATALHRPRSASIAAVGLVLILLVGAGACSSSSETTAPTTTEAVSAEQWASSVCSTLSTWLTATTTSLTSPGGSGTLSERLTTRIDGVTAATEAAVTSLKAITPPTTTNGDKAKTELEGLSSRLQDNAGVIRTFSTVQVSGVGDLVSKTENITVAVANSVTDVKDTFGRIKALDPTGELTKGFESAASCQSFATQADAVGSSGTSSTTAGGS